VFTGIVQERARVASFEGGRLVVDTGISAGIGDSVSVDGVCLTVASPGEASFEADVMNQTLRVTTLGALEPGARVNLEADLLGKYVERLLVPSS
jgi:riboflavin synthase